MKKLSIFRNILWYNNLVSQKEKGNTMTTTNAATYESAIEYLVRLKRELEGNNDAYAGAVYVVALMFDESVWAIREDVRDRMQQQ